MIIFDYESLQNKEQDITDKIQAEYKHVHISTLGGKENISILIQLSLDKKETWNNGILHNSRYYFFHIHNNGIIENFANSYKVKHIRKKTVKTLQQAIDYINKSIQETIQ
jgi:hypothetical protein